MRKKNKCLKLLATVVLAVSILGASCLSVSAATVPYRTIQDSQIPVKVGNSYVWQPNYQMINIKKSKNSSTKGVRGKYEKINGITNGSTIYYGSAPTEGNGNLLLGKYSLATGKHTVYKMLEGWGGICGYYSNKIYYHLEDSSVSPTKDKLYSFDIKTKKISTISENFRGSLCYGEYILGSMNYDTSKAYNMKTKKFTTLSVKNSWLGSDRTYGGYYYYPKYVAKASGNMNKYKIYKFNLKTGKSAPVSKTFTAASVDQVTCVEVSYRKDNHSDKLYYLKY